MRGFSYLTARRYDILHQEKLTAGDVTTFC
jgi:hypothetical protein